MTLGWQGDAALHERGGDQGASELRVLDGCVLKSTCARVYKSLGYRADKHSLLLL